MNNNVIANYILYETNDELNEPYCKYYSNSYEGQNFIIEPNNQYQYISFSFRYNDLTEIQISDAIENFKIYTLENKYNQDEINTNLNNINSTIYIKETLQIRMETGNLSSQGTESQSSNTNYARSYNKYIQINATKYKLKIPANMTARIYTFAYLGKSYSDNYEIVYNEETEFEIEYGSYIRLVVYYTDNLQEINPSNLDNKIFIEFYDTSKSIQYLYQKLNNYNYANYISLSMFTNIAVIGDSFASGSIHLDNSYDDYVGNKNLSWCQILGRMINATVTNFTAGGLSSKTWLSDKKVGLSVMLDAEPSQLYLVNLGINDNTQITNGSLILGSLSDIDITDYNNNADTFFGCYGKIISNIQEHAPNAKIIIMSVARPNERNNMDARLESIAELFNLPYIYLPDDNYFTSGDYYNSMMSNHPVAYGYAGMAKAIERLISKCILKYASYFKDFTG